MNNLRLQAMAGNPQISMTFTKTWQREPGDAGTILKFTFEAIASLSHGSDAVILLSNGNGTWYERCLLKKNNKSLTLNEYKRKERDSERSVIRQTYGIDIQIADKNQYNLYINFLLKTAPDGGNADFFEINAASMDLFLKPDTGEGDPKGTTTSRGPM